PDVIIVDVGMPNLNGLDATERVKEVLPRVKVVFLTMQADAEIAAEAFRRGASGYLLKTCAVTEMLSCIREVLRGGSYLSPALPKDEVMYRRAVGQKMLEDADKLTDRQREVLQLLAEGKAMKEVGCILGMTTRTVAFHKYRIKQILGAQSNTDLLRYAIR